MHYMYMCMSSTYTHRHTHTKCTCGHTHLNNAFKFSGNSVLPAYPGFIVINKPTVGVILISTSSNINVVFFILIASCILLTCTATTDNTSTEIRLNSSKHPHAPV